MTIRNRSSIKHMIGKKQAIALIEKLLWTIEDYIQLSSSPKSYGTDMRFYRLDIHLLDTVGMRAGINVTELAREHKITKSAVSQAVRKLEDRGLLERYRMPDNQKEVLFRLTSQGIVAFDAHRNFHKKVEAPFAGKLAKLSKEEAQGVEKLMEFLAERADLVRSLEENRNKE